MLVKRKLLQIPEMPEPYPYEENKVIAKSSTTYVDGQDILCIDLFYDGTLRGRYFANRKSWISIVDGQWKNVKMTNVCNLIIGHPIDQEMYWHYGDDFSWDTDEDRTKALTYLDTYSVDCYETNICRKKRITAIERKQDRIDTLMSYIPFVPDQMEEWLQNTIFPEQYLFIRKGNNRIEYSCTACGAESWKKKPDWKHGQTVSCPKCQKKVTAWKRKPEKTKREPVVLLQEYEEPIQEPNLKIPMRVQKWVERQFRAEATWKWGEKREINLYEDIRALIPREDTWGKCYYGQFYKADEFAQEFGDKNVSSRRFLESYLYPGNLSEVLKVAGMDHSGLLQIALAGEKFNVNQYIIAYHKREWIEYIVKGKLYALAADFTEIYGYWGNPSDIIDHAHNLQDLLDLDGNRLNRLKTLNGGYYTWKWLLWEEEQEMNDRKVKITTESLAYFEKHKINPDQFENMLSAIKSPNRLANYLKKQKGNIEDVARTWRDYLQMAEAEGMDITDDIVRFPKNLRARHDEIVTIRAKRKSIQNNKELNERIKEHLPEVKELFWESKDYMIIPAGNCEELVEEGRTLHHCVGSGTRYMESMAKGKTWILFLRKKEDLEEPYYTLEINLKTKTIIQWYSEYDRKPDAQVIRALLKRYENHLKPAGIERTA